MPKTLRKYQQDAVDECWKYLKLNDDPVLLMASVGAGKSLMLADILKTLQNFNKKALCIVNNAELVRNNHETYINQGGEASIYCAALNSKDASKNIIFGTPQSIINGIEKNEEIGKIEFNIIIVDEAHAINYHNQRSSFMRILRFYKHRNNKLRVLGATGTNYRFKGFPIVGRDCLFKTQVGNITTEYLIDHDYLVNPIFKIDRNLIIDFSEVKVRKNGLFDQKQLEKVIKDNVRTTELICKQLIDFTENQKRFGVFIFATTKKHAQEIYNHLPAEQSAIILGDTPQHERTEILDKARIGTIKYLVNIAIISVGVDVPSYDTIAYLRPTESLVLLVQTMGRGLRLSPKTEKKDCVILDYAGNLERHQEWDNPLLIKALKKVDEEKEYIFQCPDCQTLNTIYARRCIGMNSSNKRCDYYFKWKDCPCCHKKNDSTARLCRWCSHELIDPNDKLSLERIYTDPNIIDIVDVVSAKYFITGNQSNFRLNCTYTCTISDNKEINVFEFYMPCVSDKSKNYFYGQFVKKHIENGSQWYPILQNLNDITNMLKEVKTPKQLKLSKIKEKFKIEKKIFAES